MSRFAMVLSTVLTNPMNLIAKLELQYCLELVLTKNFNVQIPFAFQISSNAMGLMIVLMVRMKLIVTTLSLVKRMNGYARVTKNVFLNRIGATKIQIAWTVQMNKIVLRKTSPAIIHPGVVTMALLVLTSSKSVTKNLIVKIEAMKDFVVKIFFARHLTIIVQIIVKILQTVIGVIARPACT
jgi:hypothetical protein